MCVAALAHQVQHPKVVIVPTPQLAELAPGDRVSQILLARIGEIDLVVAEVVVVTELFDANDDGEMALGRSGLVVHHDGMPLGQEVPQNAILRQAVALLGAVMQR